MINYENYTEKGQKILMDVQDILSRYRSNQLSTEALLLSIIEDNDNIAVEILKKSGVDLKKLQNSLSKEVSRYGSAYGSGNQLYITPDARHVIATAQSEAERMQDKKIGTEHLLLGIIKETSSEASKILMRFNINADKIYSQILQERKEGTGKEDENADILKKYTINLTELAKNGKLMPVIGREEEIRRVIQIIGRKTKNNPALVGEPGVGKTAIAEGLAERIVSGDIPAYLKNKRVLALDMGRLVAGTKFRGEFEERMKGIIDSVKKLAGEIILFIDEIHTVVGAGSTEGSMDAANLMKPALARGELQCIGATTLDEYRKYIEKDKALERRFQPVMINEPTIEEAIEILKGIKESYQKHHSVEITDEAIEESVNLSKKYITDRFLPDKAIDLIDEAASYVRLETGYLPDTLRKLEMELSEIDEKMSEEVSLGNYEKAANLKTNYEKIKEEYKKEKENWEIKTKPEERVVTPEIIASIVEQWTGIPAGKLLQSEMEKLKNIESLIHETFIDQEEAVSKVTKTIKRARAGLKDPKRPWGSFLFLGPTGVGKTELAKTLARILFGSEDAMIRIDMSEYREKHTVSRLIGAPPGYVGYDEGGQLTERVRRRPYSVVLLDEVEKAHSDVHNILLQIMDDGRLTDGKGKTVNFKNTIIIMTSNIASDEFFKENYNTEDIYSKIKTVFKPEFVNRLDSIILFKPLKEEALESIVKLQLEEVKERLFEQNINLSFGENVFKILAENGYDPEYGARPIRRIVEREIEEPVADKIIAGEIKSGDKIKARVNEEKEIVIEKN
ncbi:MAG: ATP-dependent Clp protease ATP-binding subunit ClpC [Kosmotogales bacterium]|nr:ATP-dependent Clp protease ATP-binding subunit ClpC [Kosmotogales bacterium]